MRRSILLSALLLVACSPPSNEPTLDSQSANTEALSENSANAPLLSLNELLLAEDVKQGLAEAAAIDDEGTIIYWQNMLLAAADEVFLLPKERKLISGEQGRVFLKFQGMKTNYQSEFENAFFNFKDVSAVYQKYPAFKNLHEQSQALVRKRDAIIVDAAADIANTDFNGDALEEAKRQWQAAMLGAK